MSTSSPESNPAYRRAIHVIIAVALVASVVGFFAGMQHDLSRPQPRLPPGSPAAAGMLPAPTYTALRNLGPGRTDDGLTELEKLALPVDRNVEVDPELVRRPEALAARAARRAYDGAPPVVPHPVDQRGGLACLACHGEGVKVGERVAPKMSHAVLTSCTQCHVVAESPFPARTPELPPSVAENSFVGQPAPQAGSRAWTGAPPVIPHKTLMRTECMSCHGPYGHAGLKTSHPSRQSCTQCHAPSAELDQRPVSLEAR